MPGATAFLQAAQDLNVGGRTTRTQYQYTLQDADIDELNTWAPKLLAQLQKLPQLRDVASDQQTNSTMLSMIDRSRPGGALRHPAVADRSDAGRCLRPAAGDAVFHAAQQLPRDPRGQPRRCRRDPQTLSKIYIKSPVTGQMVPLSSFVKYDTQHVTFLSINHQGQFPAVTLSFNLAPGAALGDAVDAINARCGGDPHAGDDHRQLSGHGAGVPELAADPSRT